jgi:mono/diheme cytochrome c family protein
MNIRLAIVVTALLFAAIIGFGQERHAKAGNAALASAQQRPAVTHDKADRGEQAFQTHCGRCHNPPQQIPPQAAGTVLRHMRVRAMLSRDDEQAILKYIAP